MPAAILALLLEHPGELVTRDQIVQRIWPDRVVDYQQRISTSIKQIREALGDDRAQPECIETIPRKGYRFIGPVQANQERPYSAPLIQKLSQPRNALTLVLTVSVLVLLVVSISRLVQMPDTGGGQTAVSLRLLLVLPGAAEQEEDVPLISGLTHEITSRLTRNRPQSIGVIAQATAAHFDASPMSLERASRDLNVYYVVDTVLRGSGDSRQSTISLIRLRDKTQLWSKTYRLTDWPIVQDDVAMNVAEALSLRLSRAMSEDRATDLVNSQAFNDYLTGRSYLNRFAAGGRAKAIEYFERAIAADNTFAPAYAALADSYWKSRRNMDLARAAIDRALALNPELAEAHEVLAEMSLFIDKDFDSARTGFQRAIALEPGRSSARLGYATYLSAVGEFDEAAEQAAIARSLDPLSGAVFGEIGWFYLHANRPDAAIPACQRALELNQGNAYHGLIANDCLVLAHRLLGQPELAVEPALRVMNLYGDGDPRIEAARLSTSFIDALHIYWSWRIDAMRRFEDVEVDIAKAYVAMGDYNNAIATLDQALAQNSAALVFIDTDPSWAPLRHMARFKRISAAVFGRASASQ